MLGWLTAWPGKYDWGFENYDKKIYILRDSKCLKRRYGRRQICSETG
jgi:hypothetical protein